MADKNYDVAYKGRVLWRGLASKDEAVEKAVWAVQHPGLALSSIDDVVTEAKLADMEIREYDCHRPVPELRPYIEKGRAPSGWVMYYDEDRESYREIPGDAGVADRPELALYIDGKRVADELCLRLRKSYHEVMAMGAEEVASAILDEE